MAQEEVGGGARKKPSPPQAEWLPWLVGVGMEVGCGARGSQEP